VNLSKSDLLGCFIIFSPVKKDIRAEVNI